MARAFKLPSLETLDVYKEPPLEGSFKECPFLDKGYGNDWHGSGWINTFNLDLVLSHGIREGAADIHIVGGQIVRFTILGDIESKEIFGVPDEDLMADLVRSMLSNEIMGHYVKDLECDTSYKIRFGPYKGRRFRVNIGKSLGSDMITFRVIEDKIPTLDSLGVTSDVYDLFTSYTGVVLVCGATGSGKSTTLASIIHDIQVKNKKKVYTVEKPVEFIYPTNESSLITQRNIPDDCLSFGDGLTSAMRSAPDIILIGEVRDKEEVDELLRASETGHLSVSTIHTSNNVTTLNRIRSLYDGSEQRRIMSTLGDNLRGIVNQTLVKSIDGKSRFALREVLKVDFKIRTLIQEDNIKAIREIQESSQSTMEHLLLKAVREKRCTLEEARSKAPDRTYFDYLLGQT